MRRASALQFIHVRANHQTYAIPIQVIDGIPNIHDVYTNAPIKLRVGYYFRLSGKVLVTPEADYLVVERKLGEPQLACSLE
jgi:hypothetical protein